MSLPVVLVVDESLDDVFVNTDVTQLFEREFQLGDADQEPRSEHLHEESAQKDADHGRRVGSDQRKRSPCYQGQGMLENVLQFCLKNCF